MDVKKSTVSGFEAVRLWVHTQKHLNKTIGGVASACAATVKNDPENARKNR
jgi:hypothetical protein